MVRKRETGWTETRGTADERRSRRKVATHLAHRRRRAALQSLTAADEPLELDSLARQVAAREDDVSPAAVSDDRCDRAVADLYERHLPALAEDGLVSVFRGEGIFVVGDRSLAALD